MLPYWQVINSGDKTYHMKQIRILLAVAAWGWLTFTAGAQNWANGLMAYYPFEGNAADASGNGNNLTVVNATLSTNRFGQPASAYSFNGLRTNNGSTILGTNSILNLGQPGFTVQFWFKPDNTSQVTSCLFSSVNSDETADTGLAIIYNNSLSMGRISLYIGAGKSDNVWTILNQYGVRNSYQSGQWYCVTLTKTNTTYSLYINGILDNSLTNPAAASYNKSTMIRFSGYKAGVGGGVGDEVFAGGLDDIRIYNRGLASNEVAQLYASERTVCTPHKAAATAQLVNGFFVGAAITDGGCGYPGAPLVLIQGGGGSGATATAIMNNDSVVGLNVMSAGSGYSTNPLPKIVFASPPFVPTVGISYSRVNVTQHVMLGRNYVLESSPDLLSWTVTGPQFTASNELATTEFILDQTGQFFRLREVP